MAGGARGIHYIEAEGAESSTSTVNSVSAESDQGSEKVLRAALNVITTGVSNYNWGAAGLGNLRRPVSEPLRCFKCNEPGHIAAQCQAGVQSRSSTLVCFQCNQPGHFKRDCPQTVPSKFIQEWTAPKEVSRVTCFRCNNVGHRATECRTDITKDCSFCQKKGHVMNDCRLKNNRSGHSKGAAAISTGPSKNDVTQAETGSTWD